MTKCRSLTLLTMFVFDTRNKDKPRWEKFPAEEKRLKTLQSHVNGNISILPHEEAFDAPFVAFACDTGMIDGHASNSLSYGTLAHLGFMSDGFGVHFGNVVLTGQTNGEARALTKAEKRQVQDAVNKFHHSWKNV